MDCGFLHTSWVLRLGAGSAAKPLFSMDFFTRGVLKTGATTTLPPRRAREKPANIGVFAGWLEICGIQWEHLRTGFRLFSEFQLDRWNISYLTTSFHTATL